MAATLTRKLAYRMSGMSRGTSRDEDTMLVVFWKMVGMLVAGMAVLLLTMSLLGQISLRKNVDRDPFTGVYTGESDASRTNFGTVPSSPGPNR